MANEKNLKKGKATQFQSGEEAARNGRKGGKASAKKKKYKKLMKECMNTILSLKATDSEALKVLEDMGIEDTSNNMLVAVGLFNAAVKGNVEAFREIRNLIGEENKDMDLGKIEIIINTLDDIAKQ